MRRTGKTLAVRLDALGDMLVTGPAIRALAAGSRSVTVLAGPDGLYVGGNFFDTALTSTPHPGSSTHLPTLSINNPTYHPGFAIFPPEK